MNSNRQNNNNKKWEFGPPNQRNRGGEAKPSSTNRLDGSINPLDIGNTFVDGPIVSRRPANFIRPHPSEANAKDRMKAKRILKRQTVAPITENQALSRQDFLRIQEDIEWAKAVLPNFVMNYKNSRAHAIGVTQESLIVKLQMPPQETPLNSSDIIDNDYNIISSQSSVASSMMQVQSSEPKRHETTKKRTFAEIVRGRMIIGLIDNGNFEGKIPRNQWDWIQASLASVALEVTRENPGPPPSCTDAGWFQGKIKLIACDNDRSALLYKRAIAKIGEVYNGAQLEVVDIMDIPSRPWATAWLPENPSESVDILAMLSELNPELPMQGWMVIKADKFDRGMMLVIFQISEASIEHLMRCDGLLNYGVNKIRMQFYKTPHDALSNMESFAAAVDPPTDDDELETKGSHLNEDLSFLSDYEDSLN